MKTTNGDNTGNAVLMHTFYQEGLDKLKEASVTNRKLKEITKIKKASFKKLNLQAEENHKDHKLQQIKGKKYNQTGKNSLSSDQ